MKFYTTFFTVIACLLVFAGCAELLRHQVVVVPQPAPIVVPDPEVKTLTLIIGKTTMNDVASVLGQSDNVHSYAAYNTTQWIYQYGHKNNPYVLLNISATGKDGFTYTYKWSLMERHILSLSFKGSVLQDFSLH